MLLVLPHGLMRRLLVMRAYHDLYKLSHSSSGYQVAGVGRRGVERDGCPKVPVTFIPQI